jgi:hypothetical protein
LKIIKIEIHPEVDAVTEQLASKVIFGTPTEVNKHDEENGINKQFEATKDVIIREEHHDENPGSPNRFR